MGQNILQDTKSQWITDTDLSSFEEDVLKQSLDIPVLVDLWAPWCGPCKQLMPLLEKSVEDLDGKIYLVKVNIDENPQISQMLQIQSVPSVFAFYQGRPLHGFQGVKTSQEIQTFIAEVFEKAGLELETDGFDEALTYAAQLNSSGDFDQALEVYEQILQEDPAQWQALCGQVYSYAGLKQYEQASDSLGKVPTQWHQEKFYRSAKAALETAQQSQGNNTDIEILKKAIEKKKNNEQERFDLSLALFSQGDYAQAFDQLLIIIEQNKEWNDEAARKQLIRFFEQLEPLQEDVVSARKKLSMMLFK